MLIVAPAAGWDSLVSLADADTYHARMGNDVWALEPDTKREAALRRAAQFIRGRNIDKRYLDPVHERVKAAACEAAALSAKGELYQDFISAAPVLREQVGEISVSYGMPSNSGRARFPLIDDLLRGLASGAGKIDLVRA